MNEQAICHDCNAAPGEKHAPGCDVARCLHTGMQRLSCDQEDHDDCGEDVWTGEWPGSQECRELGFWCYWAGEWPNGRGWKRCEADHPQAEPDLNRLHTEAQWDREQQKFVKRKGRQEE